MNEVEKIQNKLGIYLTEIIPVPWEKICFYAECSLGYSTFWYCIKEKDTGITIPYENFFKRYNTYPKDRLAVIKSLLKLSQDFYYAYVKEFGLDKAWHSIVYVVNEDETFNINFNYKKIAKDDFELREILSQKYMGCEFNNVTEKYPYHSE